MHVTSGRLLLNRKGEAIPVAVAMVRGTLETFADHLDRLHPEEKTRFESLKHARRKEGYLSGRLSAKAALSELTGFQDAAAMFIDTGVFDFPVVRCAAIGNQQVSISHCEGISVSAAFSEAHPAGIDIEQVTDRHREVMRNQLTVNEESLLRGLGLDQTLGYTVLWSIKESLSKVIKTGMTIDFSILEVNTLSAKGDREYLGTFSQFAQYQAICSQTGNHVISITLPRKSAVDFHQASLLFSSLNDGHDGR